MATVERMVAAYPETKYVDERIDERDLGFAAQFYADIARELLG